MENIFRILAINPGSTSTKIAVYENADEVFVINLKHSTEEIERYEKIVDQYSFRKEIILNALEEAQVDMNSIQAVVGRGGLVKPIFSGTYEVNDALKHDLINSPVGEHASNLGGLIADDIAKSLPNAKAYIADPVVVDEFSTLARYSGHPLFERVSVFHALNQKAVARTYAHAVGKRYEDLNLIVAHMGGGVSVGAHQKGFVVDCNQALDGDGPFSPERSGSLPVGALIKAAFSGKYTLDDMKKMIKGNGGLVAYTGSNDAYDLEVKAAKGDAKAQEVLDAMGYQVAKEIGAMATVLSGDVDAVLITGGIANGKDFCEYIAKRVRFIAPVKVYPGEDEMRALANNGLMALTGEIEPKVYK